jgi:hypothetical protein
LAEASETWRQDAAEGKRLFDECLVRYPDDHDEIVRERALCHARDRNPDLAFLDRKTIADRDMPMIGDLFSAGLYGARASAYAEAVVYLERCISESLRFSDEYYRDSARIIAAYCHARLGHGQAALALLDPLDADMSIPWWHDGHGELDKAVVLGLLER